MSDTKLAPPVDAPTKVPNRRADIQGIRAVAVLLVVAFHAGLPIPGGYIGVDVFFVISGFVITAMLLREKQSTGRISLRTFYVRRFRRLTPALAVMVTVTVVFASLPFNSLPGQGMTAITGMGAMLLFANFAIAHSTGGYFDQAATINPLLHTWSLSVEEQFYVIFPLLLIGAWAIARRSRRPRVVVALAVSYLAALSLAIALVTSLGVALPSIPADFLGFYSPVGRAWEFSAGALLAITMSRLPSPSRRVALILGLVAIAALAYSAIVLDELTVFPGVATLIPVGGTVLLLYVGLSPANPVSRVLSSKPMVKIGDLSYSWYLWHWPAIVFSAVLWPDNPIVLLLAAALSLIPALVSYCFVEQRFRVAGSPSRFKFAALVAATLIIPLVLSVSLSYALSRSFGSPEVARAQAAQQIHAGAEAGCLSYTPITAATQASCEWNATATGEPIYLIGDSISEHYSEALIGASAALDRPLFIATAAGCPAYKIMLERPEQSIAESVTGDLCAPYTDGTLAWLDTQPAGLVIMGASDVSGWAPTDLSESYDTKIPAGFDPVTYAKTLADSKQAAVRDGMASTAVRLRAAGHDVVIAQAPPSYRFPSPSWLPSSCSVATIMAEECRTSVPVEEMDKLQHRNREAVADAAERSGSGVLDLRPYFCPDGICTTQRGDLTLYLDDIHMSVAASQALVPWFTDFIKARG